MNAITSLDSERMGSLGNVLSQLLSHIGIFVCLGLAKAHTRAGVYKCGLMWFVSSCTVCLRKGSVQDAAANDLFEVYIPG